MQKKTFILSLIIIILVCFGVYEYAFAASANYVPLAPIPGLTGGTTLGTNATQSSPGLSAYLAQLYTWSVAAASGLAVVMIMWGGVEYMTSAGGGGVEEAKKRISASIMGLLLALGSYIILSTVNKDLLKLNFNLGTLSVAQDEFKTYTSNNVDTGINPNAQNGGGTSGGASGGTTSSGGQSNTSSSNTTRGSGGGNISSGSTGPASVEPVMPASVPSGTTPTNTAPNPLLPAI